MMRIALLTLLLLFAATGPAEAYLKAGPNVLGRHHRLKNPSTPPLDAITTASTAAYSFRKLRSAYAGSALRIRRASDNLELDVGFSGNDWNNAAAVAHCAATSCFVTTWYDQSGNARNMVQATAANQPALIFTCAAANACLRATTGSQRLATAGNYTPPGVGSFNVIARRLAGTGQCYLLANDSTNSLFINPGSTQWAISGSAIIYQTAADAAWHAGIGILNGAASVMSVDNLEATGSAAGNVVAGPVQAIIGAAATTVDQVEAILWEAYALTAAERAGLTSNQRAYWGF